MSESDILDSLDAILQENGIENPEYNNKNEEMDRKNSLISNGKTDLNSPVLMSRNDEESIAKRRKQPKKVFENDDEQYETVDLAKMDGFPDSVIHDNLIMETDFTKTNGTPGSRYSEDDLKDANIITKIVVNTRSMIWDLIVDNQTIFLYLFLIGLVCAYIVFFGFAIDYGWNSTYSYCDGVKFLLIITVLVVSGLIYFQIIKRFFGKVLNEHCIKPLMKLYEMVWEYRFVRWLFYLVIIAAVVTFLVIDSKNNRSRLISAGGILILTLLGFLFSNNPGRIRWRHVFWGLGLQFVLALLILRWSVGRDIFQCLGDKVQIFLDYTDQGSSFVFGYLVTGNLTGWTNVTIDSLGIFGADIPLPMQDQLFGFKVLPVILYFSFFISILYFYGVMQWLVQKLGWCLQVTVGTTACESINAAACIFVGQSEAPLVIAPYLPTLTKSEIHAIMTGGFANIAGSTLAAYISFGIDASHLLSASIMSAPAALGYAKLMYPETEISQTRAEDIKLSQGTEKNALEAAANGASMAISLVANVAANLISFIAFIYFLDGVLSWMGALVGWDFLTIEWLLGEIFTPLAFIMGVEWDDCQKVGQLIGVKTIINEFVAYSQLAEMQDNHEISTRSVTIATYALCGFSNISSIGIQLGCMGGLCPERKQDLAQVVIRALISGCAACFMTACVAGALIDDE